MMNVNTSDAVGVESGREYQVFLSFRGPDTRWGFTDCLYHFLINAGIRVFKDDKDLPLGVRIEKVVDAVGKSQICIPIFSKDYATSKWCLRELARMVEAKKYIIPIFYDVTPDDVKLKRNTYTILLDNHLTRKHREGEKQRSSDDLLAEQDCYGAQDVASEVEQWKKALISVPTVSGKVMEENTGFGKLCMALVKEVLMKLNVKDKFVTDKLTGMKERVKAVIQMLDMKSNGVRCVGIHGQGGIGKTNLAKVVFNQIKADFVANKVVFLSDVRELSKQGLKYLQEQFLLNLQMRAISIANTDQGTRKIEDLLCGREKVLVVLDDVDHMDQMDKLLPRDCRRLLHPGSRIIFTTRDKSMSTNLREMRSLSSVAAVEDFEMKEMKDSEALQLFSKHAFKLDDPPAEFLNLATHAISVAGKLPLALEVIGSSLYGTSREEWADKIKMLARVPHKDVVKKLMISYDSLEYRTKQIFLDIACFFTSGQEITYPTYMWEACYLQPKSSIEELTSKCLIKITERNNLWMHDQLKDLGREIVCLENVTQLGRRSRLWSPEEASIMLTRTREGTKKVEALRVDLPGAGEELRSLRNLRFLECLGSPFTGNLTLSKLTWLSFKSCHPNFEAINLNLDSLVVLELSGTEVDENWAGWTNMKIGETLKVLDLRYSKRLRRAPDLSKYTKLERLVLKGCRELVEIDSVVNAGTHIKHLDLSGTSSIPKLPNDLAKLSKLQTLYLDDCHKLSELPHHLPISLTTLHVESVSLHSLPSFPQLHNLISLKLVARKLDQQTNIGWISNLTKLVTLSLNLRNITSTPYTELPSLSTIKHLADLKLTNISIGSNTGLENLCSSAPKLALTMSGCKFSGELNLSVLSNLRDLNILRPVGLEILHIPTALIKFQISDSGSSLTKIRIVHTSQSSHLKEFTATRCGSIVEIEGLGAAKSLEKCRLCVCSSLERLADLSSLTELKYLHLYDCSELRSLHLPTNLTTLAVGACHGIVDIHGLHQVENLSINSCFKLETLDNLSEAANLTDLFIGSCYRLCQLHLPNNVVKLRVRFCKSLTTLGNLSELRKLSGFSLEHCHKIVEILGLGDLESLRELSILRCDSLERLDNLSKFVRLNRFSVLGCGKLGVEVEQGTKGYTKGMTNQAVVLCVIGLIIIFFCWSGLV